MFLFPKLFFLRFIKILKDSVHIHLVYFKLHFCILKMEMKLIWTWYSVAGPLPSNLVLFYLQPFGTTIYLYGFSRRTLFCFGKFRCRYSYACVYENTPPLLEWDKLIDTSIKIMNSSFHIVSLALF